MRVRSLTATGDYSFGQGGNNYLVNSPQAVGQLVGTTLRLWQGEWYLDVLAGTPWLQQILGAFSMKSVVDMIIQGVILSVQGVTKIVSYSSSYGTGQGQSVRGLSITATIDTAFTTSDGSTVNISVIL